jgi:hypothetical protein
MLIEYYGPKPVKTVTRFWGREYHFNPLCEVDPIDGLVLLEECRDIFRLPAKVVWEKGEADDAEAKSPQPAKEAPDIHKNTGRRKRKPFNERA